MYVRKGGNVEMENIRIVDFGRIGSMLFSLIFGVMR
jgi:hypothetical protein